METGKSSQRVDRVITPEEAVKEASRCLGCNEPNCISGCPIGVAIPSVLSLVSSGKFIDAAIALREKAHMASITGRVCPSYRLCERACSLSLKGGAVPFRSIERMLGDLSLEVKVKTRRRSTPKGNYLVVGSGPAGLTIAHDLFAEGSEVTVWEREDQAGGWLRLIPPFRLPEGILDREIERLISSGIKIETRRELKDIGSALKAFDAVLLATGEPPCRETGRVDISDALRWVKAGDFPEYKKVVILDGDDSATDLARLLVRRYPRTKVEIRAGLSCDPALAQIAASEGVELQKPSKLVLVSKGACVIASNCMRTPVPFPLQTDVYGYAIVDSRFMTSTSRVYAAGGAITHCRSITEAMASGRELSRSLGLPR